MTKVNTNKLLFNKIKTIILRKTNKKIVSMIKNMILFLIFIIPYKLFSQDLSLVKNKQNQYGFVDKNGDTIIDCQYDYAEKFSNGLALVKNNLRFKVIDTTGKLYDLKDYTGGDKFRHEFGENFSGLPVLVKQWDCSYITSSGSVFLSIPYQNASSFILGKAKVFEGDKYNFISKRGILLDNWRPVQDEYHAIKYNDKYGFINKNGKLVIDYKFVKAKDFKNGFAQISNGKYWALINKKGERISNWYEKIDDFKGNIAVVRKLGNIGFINKTGKFMGQWYKTIEALDFGMYKVGKYEKFALINNQGYIVTQWFDKIFEFKDGYIKVQKGNKYAYINRIGALVVGWYDNIGKIKNGIIRVRDEDKSGFFNVETFIISDFYDYLGQFYNDLAVVESAGKYSYINKKDATLLAPLQYDKAKDFNSGIAEVEKNGKTAYINTKGKIVLGWFKAQKYFRKEPPQGIIAVKFGRKYGFQTINGRRIIPAKFDYAQNFSEGLALVKNNPTEMYINKSGKLVPISEYPKNKNIRLDFGYAHSLAPIKYTKWNCSFIDYNGNVVLNLKDFDNANSFVSGKAKVFKGDKYNFIDHKGKLIAKWKEPPDNFHAAEKNGKFGFVNKNDKLVIPYKYSYAYDFKNGTAKVKIEENKKHKYELINTKGIAKTHKYDKIYPFRNNIAIVKNNNKYAIIDTSGKEISQWYDKIYPFRENYAKVLLKNKYSFINSDGIQINKWFDNAGDFSLQRAKVELKSKWGFIDTKGKFISKPIYDNVWDYKNNMAKVLKKGKYAFIDLYGKPITTWFDRLYMFADERAVVCKDNKWGYIDFNGKLVIPMTYNRAFAFSNGKALVVKDGKMLEINKKGELIKKAEQ